MFRKVFAARKPQQNLKNLMITELFYSDILNMNSGSSYTQFRAFKFFCF